jgi:hypothetical protein
MTPKEKAHYICGQFLKQIESYKLFSMAMISDQQIAIDLGQIYVNGLLSTLDKNLDGSQFKIMNYWEEVKKEIEAL